jgi:hypothetical protein
MAAGKKYEVKDKYECLPCFVPKWEVEGPYTYETVLRKELHKNKKFPKNTFATLQAYSLS